MTDVDATQRTACGLRKALDAHGFSFQYAVLRYCEQLAKERSYPWRFEVAEFPVEVKSASTKIDFVLYGQHQDSDYSAYLVCECKRVNSAIADWAFVRTPYTRANRTRQFTVFETISIEPTTGRLFSSPVKLRDAIEPYGLGLEIKTAEKGDGGSGRGAIEEAATQVFRGVGGLVEFFKQNPRILSGRALVVPVIFTTARLYSSEVDLGSADIDKGTLPDALTAAEAPWLWFQYNVSAALRHSALQPGTNDLKSLGSVLEWSHARSIAVVNPTGIEPFLQQMLGNLEDLESMRP